MSEKTKQQNAELTYDSARMYPDIPVEHWDTMDPVIKRHLIEYNRIKELLQYTFPTNLYKTGFYYARLFSQSISSYLAIKNICKDEVDPEDLSGMVLLQERFHYFMKELNAKKLVI